MVARPWRTANLRHDRAPRLRQPLSPSRLRVAIAFVSSDILNQKVKPDNATRETHRSMDRKIPESAAFVHWAAARAILRRDASARIVQKLPAELSRIEAMLGGLARAQKNHRHIVVIQGAKPQILVDINFREARAKFLEQWRQLYFCFLAEVAPRARINRDVAGSRDLQAPLFGARVGARRRARAQPSAFDQLFHHTQRGGLAKIRERQCSRARLIE